MLNNSVFLSECFSSVFDRHCCDRHGADYDACRHWLCRLAWWLENLIWYGGRAGQ